MKKPFALFFTMSFFFASCNHLPFQKLTSTTTIKANDAFILDYLLESMISKLISLK